MSSFAQKQMNDLVALYQADEYLANINIIARLRGNPLNDVAAAVSLATPPYLTGAAIWIAKPKFLEKKPGMQGGPMELQWSVHCLAYPLLNDDTDNGGSGKQGFDIARRVALVTKNFYSGGLAQGFVMQGIDPGIEGIDDQNSGTQMDLDGWVVRFHALEADYDTFSKVDPVVISPNSGAAPQTVTLTCTTANADIYWTQDSELTHPWSGNSAATLYDGNPITAAAGILRARAFKSGSIGSNVSAAKFT